MTARRFVPCVRIPRRRATTTAAAVLVAAALTLGAAAPPADSLATLAAAFAEPPDDTRIMMRWWWFGPTVSKAGLARELRHMKAGGIGGVEIQPVYPVTLDDRDAGLVTSPFLSPAFLDHLRFAADEARGLGLRADLTLGSGWPYGGPTVSIQDAAGKLRVERVAVPAGRTLVPVPLVRPGEDMIAAFLTPVPFSMSAVREVREIRDGQLHLPEAASEAREAVFFLSSRSGMMVKRPAIGAEGFVLNHYDRAAVDRYLRDVGEPLVKAFGATPPYAVFCDSLEVYDSDWTPDFLDQFRARRGYDLRPLLPALAIDAGPLSAALRHDWARTLTDLLDERFIAPMAAWTRAHGTRFRIQGYGVPPATISSNAGIDLPEGEGSEWRSLRATRWAASVGHLYDRPVISSETWTWLHSPSFMASPVDVKAEADQHFLQGVNQLIGHGWPYTADGVEYPGWRFYAAGVFNEKNPWWIAMPDVARYLQRMSFLLRQGQPVIDVAMYVPVADTMAHFVPGRISSLIEAMDRRIGPDVVGAVLDAGFNLDFIDDGVLGAGATVEQGALVIGRNRYRALVLPGIERMPPATMRAIEAYARQGVRVIATKRQPALAPGYLASDADHAAVRDAAARLFGPGSTHGALVAEDAALGAALAAAIEPDVVMSAGAPAIGFVHRRTDAGDLYFVANTANTPQALTATFRTGARSAQRWDAMTGSTAPVAVAEAAGSGRARVELALAPYESTVIVFPSGTAHQTRGPVRRGAVPPPLDLSRDWHVSFGPGQPAESWPALRSWTDEERTRYFSGVASYTKTVSVPPGLLARGIGVTLDFGEARPIPQGGPKVRHQAWIDAPVRDAAVVWVNGQRAGSVWCPPYAVDVTRLLRPGTNDLRIDVANTAINHMAGRALPDYRLLNLRYGTRFEPQDMDRVAPLPAGLFGPIRLVAAPAGAGRRAR